MANSSKRKKASLPTLSAEDQAIFRSAMHDVTPFLNDKAALRSEPTALSAKTSLTRLSDSELAEKELYHTLKYSGQTHPVIVPHASEWHETPAFIKSGVNPKVLKKLRQAQYTDQNELDLHGLTVEAAHACVLRFIRHALQREQRYVRIIHGKGLRSERGGVLKVQVPHWLQHIYHVLAYCSAPPNQGGSGALLVLLRWQPHEGTI